jgi:hypothetical protein
MRTLKSEIKKKHAGNIRVALASYSTQVGDLRELGEAVGNAIEALELRGDRDSLSCMVLGLLVKYGMHDPSTEDVVRIELLLADCPGEYWTVVVPPVPSEARPTEWHDEKNTLTRGAFKTDVEAIQWAREHLNGAPYSLRFVRTLEA